MALLSKQRFNIFDYHLEVVKIQGDLVENYATVVSGYVFHFSLSDSIVMSENSRFSIELDSKQTIIGSLEELEVKLEKYKAALLDIDEKTCEYIDQYAYIYLFIVPKDEQYQLIVASETFDVSQLINLYE